LARAAGRREVEIAVADRTTAVLALAGIPGAEIVGDGADGRIRVSLDQMDAAGLNRALVLAGVGVSELVSRGGSLEELFLSVTSAEPGVEERA